MKQLERSISQTTVAKGKDLDAALVTLVSESGDGDTPKINLFEAMTLTTWFRTATLSRSPFGS